MAQRRRCHALATAALDSSSRRFGKTRTGSEFALTLQSLEGDYADFHEILPSRIRRSGQPQAGLVSRATESRLDPSAPPPSAPHAPRKRPAGLAPAGGDVLRGRFCSVLASSHAAEILIIQSRPGEVQDAVAAFGAGLKPGKAIVCGSHRCRARSRCRGRSRSRSGRGAAAARAAATGTMPRCWLR